MGYLYGLQRIANLGYQSDIDFRPQSRTLITYSNSFWKDYFPLDKSSKIISGLFSALIREQTLMVGSGPKWMIMDGDVDPMWIESLNTLMDDNKVCQLSGGNG